MTASSSGWTPLFLNADPHRTGVDRDVERRLADVLAQPLGLDRLLLEVVLHQLRRRSRRRPRSAPCAPRRRPPEARPGCPPPPTPGRGRPCRRSPSRDRSMTPLKSPSEPIGSWIGIARSAPSRSIIVCDRVVEVGPDAIHLVDVGDPRDAVLVGLAPDRLGLGLDAGDGVEEGDRAVEHAQRALDLDGEVDVAWRVDDVDAVVAPEGRRGGRGDRDAALLLLLHPVHRPPRPRGPRPSCACGRCRTGSARSSSSYRRRCAP